MVGRYGHQQIQLQKEMEDRFKRYAARVEEVVHRIHEVCLEDARKRGDEYYPENYYDLPKKMKDRYWAIGRWIIDAFEAPVGILKMME